MSRENKTLDTYDIVGRDCEGHLGKDLSQLQNLGSLTVFIVRQVIMICGYVTGFEELFKSNQIDSGIKWVSGFQVFCKEIKSNAVSKLFILVWHYEGMKVLDLGYENSYEYFSITPICHIFSSFS